MADYTKYKRGSEWRRWDLHIHTPETKKNDHFEGATPDEKWQKYVEAINASTEDISVVGITDYFCLDNYFKFKKLITDGTISKKFDLVIPNVEIRVTPVTGSSTPINLHCIFNPSIEGDIESRFLGKLNFKFGDSDYSGKKDELIRLGKDLPGNKNLDESSALKAGLQQYVVSIDVVRAIFEKDTTLRENTIIVVSNSSSDGASGIRTHEQFFVSSSQSQMDATRWSIYQFSDAIFSSNEKDVLYFTALGPDTKDSVIEKCGALMPCFHGCDAHDNSKIFKPDQNRFCWIKADPTFEGLKQTLYEPADRVRISAIRPDIKNERFVISEVRFLDSSNLFGDQKMLLNDNLNAIIGGKSSGKSLLLYSIAKCIDPEQVERASKRLGFEGYNLGSSFNFEVTWKNGEKDTLNDTDLSSKVHKITYIPQLYINYLVEKNNKEELNNLIKGILLQDTAFRSFYEQKVQAIKEATILIEALLNSFLQVRSKALEISQQSKELGTSDTIAKGIIAIEDAIKQGQQSSNLSEGEFIIYTSLLQNKSTKETELRELHAKKQTLGKVLNEIETNKSFLLGNKLTIPETKGQIDRILDELTTVPSDVLQIRDNIQKDYEALISNLKVNINKIKIEDAINNIQKEIDGLNTDLKPYLQKMAGQEELKKIAIQLDAERLRYQNALNLEKQFHVLKTDYNNLREQTVAQLKIRFELYKELVLKINETKGAIAPEISLNSSLIFKKSKFLLYEQVNKAALSSGHYFETLFNGDLVEYDEIVRLYAEPFRVFDNKINFSQTSIPLKQNVSFESVLKGLVADGFEIDYTVTYKGDDLLNMSPGKKGTVLLILFLQISSNEYPILIDQPEDNLDNRTIYDLLCTMIKTKKRERQIIIVSHNANLVVATDTENIIVANQEGQGGVTTAGSSRFQYVNGSLEHSFPVDVSKGSLLYQQGIKEHVTDILEGGDEAFKQRERKYSIK